MDKKKEISVFMEFYYNQNYDLVFGSLRNSIQKFCSDYGQESSLKLLDQIIELAEIGIISHVEFNDTPNVYWNGMGGMMIMPEDISEFKDAISMAFD